MSQVPPRTPIGSASNAPAVPTGSSGQIETDKACINCGYNLRGLQATGVCPECATPVAHSLRGNLLRYSSTEYLALLHRGVFLVQTSIIIQILMGFALIGASFIFTGATQTVTVVASLVGLPVAGMSLYGWWLFSELDPGFTGQDAGTTPRKVIRVAVIVGAAVSVVDVLAELLRPTTVGTGATTGMDMVTMALGAVSIVATIAQYFASMLYIRWLAARVPNEKARKRAKMLMWLGPLLMTVGLFLIGLGPLIALVLYWNLLDWIRKDLKRIREAKQAPPTRPVLA